jgi:23S rRNA (cytosine1962-C5)-methyltransferase
VSQPTSPGRLSVRLTPDALRQVRGGHPWVFDSAVRSARPVGGAPVEQTRPGDLAVVFDDRRRFVAVGLWDPESPIRIRVLHRGSSRPIDGSWFRERIDEAAARRDALEASPDTTGYRLVNGENDGLPGLVLDRYEDTLVLKLYTAAWYPHLPAVLDAVVGRHRPRRIVLRLARVLRRGLASSGATFAGRPIEDGRALVGDLPREPVLFAEGGLRFEADVVAGQKTGFFLDQRDNRAKVRAASEGGRVLDVFSCTGGFSVNAAAGGARSVHSVDISPGAIAATRRNMAHNVASAPVRRCEHETSTGDAMEVMAALAERRHRFDVVVVDPPSFASKQHQVTGALRSYGRLTTLAVALLRPRGLLVQASCSARVPTEAFVDVVVDSAFRAGAHLGAVEVTGHGVDHPIGFVQGAYLKAVFARAE